MFRGESVEALVKLADEHTQCIISLVDNNSQLTTVLIRNEFCKYFPALPDRGTSPLQIHKYIIQKIGFTLKISIAVDLCPFLNPIEECFFRINGLARRKPELTTSETYDIHHELLTFAKSYILLLLFLIKDMIINRNNHEKVEAIVLSQKMIMKRETPNSTLKFRREAPKLRSKHKINNLQLRIGLDSNSGYGILNLHSFFQSCKQPKSLFKQSSPTSLLEVASNSRKLSKQRRRKVCSNLKVIDKLSSYCSWEAVNKDIHKELCFILPMTSLTSFYRFFFSDSMAKKVQSLHEKFDAVENF
ncbi:MAG: hypothetical protein EXX96DRAFT_543083 [Benjaminiella poitrasii]|nr:MAG: hypothetical protein EXX96DRAFT_543083 [Benjaminiella poitrasii]